MAKSTQRMAVDGVKELLKPWAEVSRTQGTDPMWFGKDWDNWTKSAENLKGEIKKNLNAGYSPEQIQRVLIDNKGFAEDEAMSTILDIQQNKPQPLRLVDKKVPQAYGDEQLSIAALQAAGMSPVKRFNAGNSFATDIEGMLDGELVGIDAQQRSNRAGDLNLSAVLTDKGMVQALRDAPDELVKDVINRRREQLNVDNMERFMSGSEDQRWLGREGKLLDSEKWNQDNPSIYFQQDPEAFDKELLISSLRRKGQVYNRQMPDRFDVIDLERARKLLLNHSYNKLGSIGVTPRDDSSGLTFRLPSRVVNQLINVEGGRGKLPPEINEEFINIRR
jgi:hypothetical protein